MKTLAQIANVLRTQLARRGGTQEALSHEAGISRQTLSKVLSGHADFKVTTLLALADRLGLELHRPRTCLAAVCFVCVVLVEAVLDMGEGCGAVALVPLPVPRDIWR